MVGSGKKIGEHSYTLERTLHRILFQLTLTNDKSVLYRISVCIYPHEIETRRRDWFTSPLYLLSKMHTLVRLEPSFEKAGLLLNWEFGVVSKKYQLVFSTIPNKGSRGRRRICYPFYRKAIRKSRLRNLWR